MNNKKSFVFFLFLIFCVVILFFFSSNIVDYYNINCSFNDRILTSVDKRYNVFFVESNEDRKTFDIKELCAIESAAKHNPNARVIVKVLKAKIDVPELLTTYPNIEWSIVDLEDLFKNTPMMKWWLSGKLVKKYKYRRYAHLSDAIRYTLVYKYGGLYSDIDTITLKSFEPLTDYSGFVGNRLNPKELISNGFFHFTKNHPFLLELLNQVPKAYDPNVWGSIGPFLIRQLVRDYCHVSTFDELMHLGIKLPKSYDSSLNSGSRVKQLRTSERMNPCNITIFPYYVSYPFSMSKIADIFKHDASLEVYHTMHSYSIHLFGSHSRLNEINFNEFSIYEFYLQSNCPITHTILKSKSNIERLI